MCSSNCRLSLSAVITLTSPRLHVICVTHWAREGLGSCGDGCMEAADSALGGGRQPHSEGRSGEEGEGGKSPSPPAPLASPAHGAPAPSTSPPSFCSPVLDAPLSPCSSCPLLSLVQVWVSPVSPLLTSSLLRALNAALPLPSLQHLKRVFSSRAMACPTVLLCTPPLSPLLSSPAFSSFHLAPELRWVPSRAPVSRAEAEEAKQSWPLSSVAVKEEPTVIFSPADEERMAGRMRSLMDLADEGWREGQRWRAACIVDPTTEQTLAAEHDHSRPHSSCSSSSSHPPQQAHHVLHHPTLAVLSSLAAAQRRAAASASAASPAYLCTGLDLYLTHEPCLMCAMAIVHSRVRRVLYALGVGSEGGLGGEGGWRLHRQRGLNHRMDAFEGLLRAEVHSRQRRAEKGKSERSGAEQQQQQSCR